MKAKSKSILTHSIRAALALALLAAATPLARGLTVPIAQDTASLPTGKIAAATGNGPTLAVNAKQKALLRFDLSDLNLVPAEIDPGNIQSATLRLYVISAKSPGSVTVHAITSNWQEHFTGAPVPLPTISPSSVGTILPADLLAKSFVTVDVTAAVKAALQSGSDFGFSLETTVPTAKIVFASKEGAATGYAAELEILSNTAVDGSGNFVAGNGTFSGTLGAASATITGGLGAASGTFSGNIGAANATLSGQLLVSNAFVVEPRPTSTGSFNTFIGADAGKVNTNGSSNIFIGQNSGKANTTGDSNTFIGLNAGQGNTSGTLNTFIGQGAGAFSQTGNNNTCVGQAAGFNLISSSSNSFFGWKAGFASATGASNTFIGDRAGTANTTSFNTFVGATAGLNNANGGSNVFVGYGAGATNISGNQNSFFGINAGNKTTNNFNSFFGAGAGQNNTSGLGNSAIGNVAGFNNTTGSNNTFLGGNSGGSNSTEDKNTFVGDSANGATGITNSTALGQGASVTISNAVVLGNNCSVGVRTSAPNSTLQVNGSLSLATRNVNSTALAALSDNDYFLLLTGTIATTVVLPQPGIAGRVFVIKNRSSAAATLGFLSGGTTIDGAATLGIPVNTVVQVICDGSNWYKMN